MEPIQGDFYITTPIYYINDKPHIGSAYTTIVADVLARWRTARGDNVTFLTGTDEFSQKTTDAAAKNDEEVYAYTDRMSDIWMDAWAKLGISNTDFIRTTEERHINTVKDIWERLEAAGDIYKGEYQGLYCKGHEAFLKEDELTPDGLCPEHKTEPELVTEENYFFRLSNYQQALLDLYEAQPDFVAPAHRFAEVRAFVENGLEDISFSREKKRDWGIPVPNDPGQIIYVWADALVNYISAIGVEKWEEHPADVHTVGKDILRFHAVIWPAMLLSVGLPLPGQIIANGFITVNGTKMGKSLGNAVDPFDLTARYGNDALRYFLLREIPYGSDGDYTEEKFRERYNADLANGLGNFASRVLTLAAKEELKSVVLDAEFETVIKTARRAVQEKMSEYKFNDVLSAIWVALSFGDKYVNEEKIWEIKDDTTRAQALFNLISLLSTVGDMLVPFMPETSRKISAALTWNDDILKVEKPDVLFPRMK